MSLGGWVVDTCIVIDVLRKDPLHGVASARLLNELSSEGLVLCPVCFVELAPAFLGDIHRQQHFLDSIGIDYEQSAWTREDTLTAHAAWHRHTVARRMKASAKRPVADVLIGAFAMRHTGLLTRSSSDFGKIFPELAIRTP